MFVVPIELGNGIAAAVLLICSLALYESARHVIWGRKFYVAWSGSVAGELVDEGPYARIRHPIYTSYILAFLALFVAMPILPTLFIFIFNAALFTHAAFRDERDLLSSALAGAYAEYKSAPACSFRGSSAADQPSGRKVSAATHSLEDIAGADCLSPG